MSVTSTLGGIASSVAHIYDFYDSNKIRKDLRKNARQVRHAGENVVGWERTLHPAIMPSVLQNINKIDSRIRGAKVSMFGAFCNLANAINNTLLAGLQLGSNPSSEPFQKSHPLLTKVSSGIAGTTDVFNGFIQASNCLSAAKSWWHEQDPASRDMYKWHAINQGLQTVATWGRGASSFIYLHKNSVDLGRLGEVATSIVGAAGAAVLSVGANLLCKNRIEAAKNRNNKNAEVHKAALEIQPSAQDVYKNVYQFASKKYPNDAVLATFADVSPEKGFCAKYYCCCCKRKPAVEKDEGQIEIVIPDHDKAMLQSPVEMELPDDDKAVLKTPSPQSPAPQLLSLNSPPILQSPNSPPPHPFTDDPVEEQSLIH